jgi:hypothetical protein
MKKLIIFVLLLTLLFAQDTVRVEFDDNNIATTDLDFKEVPINKHGEFPIYLSNSGNMTLYLHDIKMVNGTEFSIKGTVDSLVESEQDSISLSFNPETKGSYLDTLIIESNDPNLSKAKLPVLGVGGAAKFKIYVPQSPTMFDF